jgi:heterodisulfide reductase subunit B2
MLTKPVESNLQDQKDMEFSYYPGCSLHSTAWEYNDSVETVFKAVGVGLKELDDWNCCSAASAHSISHNLSLTLPGRNLAIAQKAGRDVVMPCSACYGRHKTTEYELKNNPESRSLIEDAVGFHFDGSISIRPLLDVVMNEMGFGRIKSMVKRPLKGLKVVSYYGCLLVRPPDIVQFENPEAPTYMNRLLGMLGADVKPWSYATDCCGGDQALVKPSIAVRLVDRLVERAREAGADAMVTCCPLCQMNLEMRQSGKGKKMPLFYFTEAMGLAFGSERTHTWWGKHLINPAGLLQSLSLY